MAKFLWVRYGIPTPSRTSRDGAIYNTLAGLSKGSEVHLSVLVDREPTPDNVKAAVTAGAQIRTTVREDAGPAAGPVLRRTARRAASIFSLSPLKVWRYNPRRFREEVAYSVHEIKPTAVVFDQWFLYPTIQKLAAKRVFYAVGVEWLFNERFADETDNVFLSTIRTVGGGRRKVHELKSLACADAVVCSSAAVKSELGRYYKRPLSVVAPPIERPREKEHRGFKSREIIYATDLFARRDATAVKWLARFVLPRTLSNVPDAILTVKGDGAERYLEPLLREPWIRLSTEDAGSLFEKAAVAVFPHWSGGGYNFAALNALAFGVPVVATPVGAEGTVGGERSGVAVRLRAEPFAEELIKLLTDERLYEERSAAATTYAEKTLYGNITSVHFLGTTQDK
jgi:glycosyltransferase involved in cell wall biosynthesis